ncbi:recombinase family protein [Phenylobacterium sp. J426]|uniref:recombinase family protein n=1 Tax=Phenylobacterium sp. J426 TaxID=2898439 RepID=UPI0035AE90CE
MAQDPHPRQQAAQYLRMSTERQDLSLSFQRATNASYASKHGLKIVRTYSDEGVSGLNVRNRPGLQALLADVVSGDAEFTTILVYDVSRWGALPEPGSGGTLRVHVRRGRGECSLLRGAVRERRQPRRDAYEADKASDGR